MELFEVLWEGGGRRVFADRDEAECCAFDHVCDGLRDGRLAARATVRYPDGRRLSVSARELAA